VETFYKPVTAAIATIFVFPMCFHNRLSCARKLADLLRYFVAYTTFNTAPRRASDVSFPVATNAIIILESIPVRQLRDSMHGFTNAACPT
jgi:hypothetical protein